MARTVGYLLLVISVTLLGPVARSTDTDPARGCAEIANDTHRLACYDRLFAPATPSEPAKSSSTAPAAASASTVVGDDDFGLSEADKRRATNAPAVTDSITVTIQSIGRRPTGEQVFTTMEGQVWVELEPSSRVRVQPGQTVTIRKAALGSYTLVTPTKVGAKVRRVN